MTRKFSPAKAEKLDEPDLAEKVKVTLELSDTPLTKVEILIYIICDDFDQDQD